MKIIGSAGREDIAVVYIGELSSGKMVEFVEAVQPPVPREQKWVLLVSTLYGCPVGCKMCDAGGFYQGKVAKEDIFSQIDFMVRKRYPDEVIPAGQFKIQFARMGEPAFNLEVLDVIAELPDRYQAPGFMPSISTIAPHGTDAFFERLLDIKRKKFSGGRFQFQFSIHSTDETCRDEIIPVKKWGFEQMAAYGERFYEPGDRKVTLNFALARDVPLEPERLQAYFDPGRFLIKITPLNPTYRAREHGLATHIEPWRGGEDSEVVRRLRAAGYQVIVSIGEVEENFIGSNCGQYLRAHLESIQAEIDGYTYQVTEYAGNNVI
jgi:23S rRNA (adenine2503-C2)-methyltransferase